MTENNKNKNADKKAGSSTPKSTVHVVDHPLISHKLNKAREKSTGNADFRRLVSEISALMCYECTRDLETFKKQIETPITTMNASFIDHSQLVLISILRAGNGILDGMMNVMPEVRVGHIGIYRDPTTHAAIEYYFKVPDLKDKTVLMVDPMLATGHTAVAALGRISEYEPKNIKFISLLASQNGIDLIREYHPEVEIYTAAIDDHLSESCYIVPGLGDAGDRLYGTQ